MGSAGCQPAVAGSLPATSRDVLSSIAKRVSAGCRDVQAGSLRSPTKDTRLQALRGAAHESFARNDGAFVHAAADLSAGIMREDIEDE
jgi:hypothetical protein